MPSPLAHVGAALALVIALERPGQRVPPRVVLAAALASVAPDLDIALALVHPAGLAWHRGPSHSLAGAALLGGLCAWGARVRGGGAYGAVVSAALLHVLFDWSTGEPSVAADPLAVARYGVPWAWPFSSAKAMDPAPWFGAFRIDEAGFLANMWSQHALPVYAGELGTAGVLVGAALLVRRARRRAAAR